MRSNKIILVVILSLAVLSATLWLGMRLGERNATQGVTDSQIPGGKTATMPPIPAITPPLLPQGSSQVAPPWATPNVMQNGKITGAPGGPDQLEKQKKLNELKLLQMEVMKSMQQPQGPDPKQVDALLLKIKEVAGTSTINGIDIEALRRNLAKSMEVKVIAEKMESESRKPGGGDQNKIKAYAEQIQHLQRQLVNPMLQAKSASGSTP